MTQSPQKPGRNDPCPCGSGKKYKQCCLLTGQTAVTAAAEHGAAGDRPSLAAARQGAQALLAESRLEAAAELLQPWTQEAPGATVDAEALHLLGVVRYRQQRIAEAKTLFQQAIALQPKAFLFHSNLGNLLYATSDYAAAAQALRRCLALQPDFAPAYMDLGGALVNLGQPEEAVASYRESLRLKPGMADTHLNLGRALYLLERWTEAEAAFRDGLKLAPNSSDGYLDLGNLLQRRGDRAGAVNAFMRSIAANPKQIRAYYNLGILLDEVKRYDDALAVYQQGLEVDPAHAPFLAGMAAIHLHQSHYEAGLDCARQALALDPKLATAHSYLGSIQRQLGDAQAALASYARSLQFDPDNTDTIQNYLFILLYSHEHSAAEVFSEYTRLGAALEAPYQALWPVHRNNRDAMRRLKIGYVSGDFRLHPVASFLAPVMGQHDHDQFEIHCYDNHLLQDDVTEQLMAQSDHWLAVTHMTDDELAARIMADGIDILIDLSGHTAHNRLLTFARKPAPVQMNWIGYPSTTGLTAIDYRITDDGMDPPGLSERYHTERLIHLPNAWAFQSYPSAPPVNDLPALTSGEFMLASLNLVTKINPPVVQLWSRILQALPQARLMLANIGSRLTSERLLAMFASHGIAAERLVLQPRVGMTEYLALHHQIDLGLDPFPYNGGTITNHALWMGVPVVTLPGERTASRMGVMLLQRVGLQNLIARDEDNYVNIVVELAHDLPRLQAIRQDLRRRMQTGINDAAEITRNLEAAYRQAWQDWLQQTA